MTEDTPKTLDEIAEAISHLEDMFAYRPEDRPQDLSPEQMVNIYRHNYPEKEPIIPHTLPTTAQ